MMALGNSRFITKDTKSTKFGDLIIRNLCVLRDLHGGNSFPKGCAVAILAALVAPAIGNTQPLCVRLTDIGGIVRSVPGQLGNTLRLKFRHSIYGSEVEEVFTLQRNGFQLNQLRYSEARLVDFYGHDQAKHANGAWIVNPTPTLIPALSISLSNDAAMSLQFDRSASSEPVTIQPTGALRLTVASCQSSAHG